MNIVGNTFWYLISASDLMSRLVLLVLFVMSIICLTILFYVSILVNRRQKEVSRALSSSKNIEKIEDLLTVAAQYHYAYPGRIFSHGLAMIKRLLIHKTGNALKLLSSDDLDMFKLSAEQEVESVMNNESVLVSFISASAALSPLLGLFGTVWGLIDAFVSISQKQNTDIATVAPGVAQALVTTAAGLMVAIPALAMVYYLNNKLQHLEMQLYKLSDTVLFISYRLFSASPMSINIGDQDDGANIIDVLDIAAKTKKENVWHE